VEEVKQKLGWQENEAFEEKLVKISTLNRIFFCTLDLIQGNVKKSSETGI
jgi:hypothetical protein